MNKRQYKKHKKKMFKVLLDSEAFRIPHAYKEYYQGRTVPMLLDGLAETVLNLVADNKENKDIYDSYHPRYFNTDTFKNAILENEKKGDAILRSAILASKDVDKNTLMLKNIAGIARNNGKDVVVLCSDERKSAWEKEKTEDFTKIKDYRNLARKLHPTTVGCEMNCTGWLFASLFVFSSFNVLTFVFVSSLAFNVFLNFLHNCRSCCCYKVAVTPERSISPQIFLYFFRVIRPHLF